MLFTVLLYSFKLCWKPITQNKCTWLFLFDSYPEHLIPLYNYTVFCNSDWSVTTGYAGCSTQPNDPWKEQRAALQCTVRAAPGWDQNILLRVSDNRKDNKHLNTQYRGTAHILPKARPTNESWECRDLYLSKSISTLLCLHGWRLRVGGSQLMWWSIK